jgi:hypothetical protein
MTPFEALNVGNVTDASSRNNYFNTTVTGSNCERPDGCEPWGLLLLSWGKFVPKSSKAFGAEDRQPCPVCGERMYVSRRTPHPVVFEAEKQTLACTRCEEISERTVNRDGQVIG